MNPITLPSSTFTAQAVNSVEKKQFLARVQVLAGIISAVFVSVLAVVMALGIVHPAIIVLASVLGLIAFVSLMKCAVDVCRKHIMPPCSIPSGCLQVICDNYPLVIGDLCKQERLTIQELRQVLSILGGSGDLGLENISIDLRKKLDSFGWERVVQSCEGSTLPSLDDELTRSCCLYFLKRFIDLGPKDIPISEGMAPEVYWMSNPGLVDVPLSAVGVTSWLLASVVTEEEYKSLREDARSNNWGDEQQQKCRDLVARARIFFRSQSEILSETLVPRVCWCRYFFSHGMSWEQIQLIKGLSCDQALFFGGDDESKGCFDSVRTVNDWICFLPQIFPYLDESSPKYDPGVALITWQEFQTAMAKENKKIFKKRTEGYAKRAVFALNILNRYAYYTKFSPVPLSSLSDQWKVCLYEYQEGQRLSRQRV
ncbi:DUF1389 domain-containing protein [Chlamydia gallinacea]|uniref:DUF1389 domain-containing protein n=1 Tax=Chlamydia gallinacea TaxID=1457153 RepID=UPI0023F013C6|nr:DUF1389 domain-containing protein [Chlamydia gallinacea]